MQDEKGVALTEFIDQYELEVINPDVSCDDIYISVPETNRPALPLTGFFQHFESKRIQLIGNAEIEYIKGMPEPIKEINFDEILSYVPPCVIFTSNNQPDPVFVKYCNKYGVPCLLTDRGTTEISNEVVRWLKVKLAPCITVHGVLMDVFGEGVLIMGESGIGKSEAALELIKRGHRLVSDDVVELSKVSDVTIVGRAPNITKHFIELRGIGIIDVKALYGVECVKDSQQIDMVIQIEEWDRTKEYDRLGMEDNYIEFMGNKVTGHTLPIRPGRNLAIICETAAVNHRQKKMGYNAARELYNRVQKNINKGTHFDGAL
ncbi:MAG: HPr(Ser) kinase/phosphatase [Lachnospiraceae bacterium]|nr:HPr(Ser) kinase/phosphatase [Lachnospiraceae bacterium]